MKRIAILSVILLAASCSSYTAAIAPDRMRGMEVPDLIACAGLPDQKMITKPDVMVLEWGTKSGSSNGSGIKTPGWSFSLPLGTSFSVSIPEDSCHMQATVLRDGTVADVDFSSTDSLKDANGACGQLVKQCTYDQSDTGLPKGYDAFQYFFPGATDPSAEKSKK